MNKSKNTDITFRALAFLLPLMIYTLTVNPTVSFTDSGELSAVCSTLGIAHPTGYPLFTLIGFLWLKLPLPISNVQSLNIMVSLFTAISSYFLFNSFLLIFKKFNAKLKMPASDFFVYNIAIAGSLAYSFALTVWQQSTSVEVYSLHLLLMNVVIFYALKGHFESNFQNKFYIIASLFLGLSFANHLTTILIVPALIYLYFSNGTLGLSISVERLKYFGIMALFVLLGLSVYMYLPLRSMTEPEFNWGMVHRSFDKFMYHIQGKQYQVWMFSGEQVSENIGRFFSAIPYQLAFIGIPFIFWGIWRLFKSSKPILIFVLIFIISCYFYSINYSIHDIETYFLTAYLGMIILAFIGIYDWLDRYRKYYYLALLIPLISFILNYPNVDQSKNYLVEDFAKTLVNNLEKDAVIISSQWDYWNSAFWYYQHVENFRKDVVLIEKELLRRTWYPLQLMKWYPEVLKKSKQDIENYMVELEKFESGANPEEYKFIQSRWEQMLIGFIEKNIDSKPIYVTMEIMNAEPYLFKNYQLVPEGLTLRLYKDQKFKAVTTDNINLDRFIVSLPENKNHLELGIMESASFALSNIGRYAQINNQDFETAKKAYSKALKINPENAVASQGLYELQGK